MKTSVQKHHHLDVWMFTQIICHFIANWACDAGRNFHSNLAQSRMSWTYDAGLLCSINRPRRMLNLILCVILALPDTSITCTWCAAACTIYFKAEKQGITTFFKKVNNQTVCFPLESYDSDFATELCDSNAWCSTSILPRFLGALSRTTLQ